MSEQLDMFADANPLIGRERTMKIVSSPTRKRAWYGRVLLFHKWNGVAQPFSGGRDG